MACNRRTNYDMSWKLTKNIFLIGRNETLFENMMWVDYKLDNFSLVFIRRKSELT